MGIVLLTAASLGGIGTTEPARRAYVSARHFAGYFEALEKDHRVGFLGRIALSLVLAGTEEQDGPQDVCRPS